MLYQIYPYFPVEKIHQLLHPTSIMKSGNLLILQSGNPSVVGNAVLYGMLSEALNHEDIEEIYGVYNGFEGIIRENFVDLADLSQKNAQLLLTTDGYVMGSEPVANYASQDFNQMIAVLSQRNIHYVGIIGDQKSLEWMRCLEEAAKNSSYELQVIAVPQSNCNETPLTEHSLGYGSYLKFLNSYVIALERFLKTAHIPVGICEIEGGNNGWLVAGAVLHHTSKNPENAPYIVCLPEQPFNEAGFLEILKQKLEKHPNVCIVTHSQLVNEDGTAFDLSGYPNVGAYLYDLLQRELGLSPYLNFCDLNVQPFAHFISKTDAEEATLCGHKAIQLMAEGSETDKAIVLTRKENATEISCLPVQELSSGMKFLPTDWINEKAMEMRYAFVKYALPLLNGEIQVSYEKGLPQSAQI